MANIRVDIDFTIKDGCDIVFKAPCDASSITGLIIYYPNTNNVIVSQLFTFKDAHGNNLGNISNLFKSGALVKVILDTVNNYAYIQNADTNAYLEGRLQNVKKTTVFYAYYDYNSHVLNMSTLDTYTEIVSARENGHAIVVELDDSNGIKYIMPLVEQGEDYFTFSSPTGFVSTLGDGSINNISVNISLLTIYNDNTAHYYSYNIYDV